MVTNRWVRGPDMMERRVYLHIGIYGTVFWVNGGFNGCRYCLAVFRGQLWAVGGLNEHGASLSSCEYLDAASNKWMAGPPMITPRYSHGLAVVDGQLWAVGGCDGRTSLQSSERLDATANAWVAGPDLPAPTRFLCCVAK